MTLNIIVGGLIGLDKVPKFCLFFLWEDDIKMKLQEVGWAWTGFTLLRTGTDGGLL
jgi:hypothetical protein